MAVSTTLLIAIVVTILLWYLSTWILSFFVIVDNVLGWIILVVSLMIGIFVNCLVEKYGVGGGNGGGM